MQKQKFEIVPGPGSIIVDDGLDNAEGLESSGVIIDSDLNSTQINVNLQVPMLLVNI